MSTQAEFLTFPNASASLIEPYLPTAEHASSHPLPFLTLTFAQSLEGSLALAPGTQTHLSGPETKALTHHLRLKHDAILIGVGTAITDDPGLNCRIGGAGLGGQPRPVILDTHARWNVTRESKCIRLARDGLGQGPWVICATEPPSERSEVLREVGGEYIQLSRGGQSQRGLDWRHILHSLKERGIKSVMVEGGGQVINTLLGKEYQDLIDVIIVTIAPVWLGQGGVVVSPESTVNEQGKKISALRLKDVNWYPFKQDVVLCGRTEK